MSNSSAVRLRLVSALAASAVVAASLVASAAPGAGPLRFAATVVAGAGGEPNVAVSPDGKTVLIDGLNGGHGEPAALSRSVDGGRTFRALHPTFSNTGGGDFDMRFLDNHTLIAVDLSLSDGIYVHRSTDRGSTWTTTVIHTDVYDRPWVEHAGADRVYVVTKGFDGVPYLYTSGDGGRTFGSTPTPVYGTGVVPAEAGGTSPNPVEAFVTNQNAYVDHVVTDPRTGGLYVLYGIDSAQTYGPANPTGVPSRLYVAHLQENGQFVSHPVYLGGAGDGFVDGFNWMTVDRSGTLYVLGNGLHAGHESAWLSFSKDAGVTWSPLVDVGRPGATNIYGSIAGAGRGVLSLVTLRGSNANPSLPQPWYAEMSRITAADTANPHVERVRALNKPVHTSDVCFSGILCGVPGFGSNRQLLDYIWNAVGPDGRAHAVVASDGPASGSSGSRVDVVYLRQVGGPVNGPGAPS
ncbi:MAG: hypothetical protein M3N21_04705 [Actinomycetota bacterium]|nr:hypothetical protein [Actinomycetota bacterium]